MRRRVLSLAATVALAGGACSPRHTCPEGQYTGPASSASAWVEVGPPRDLSLLQASARVALAGDQQAVIRPLHRAQLRRLHVRAGDRVAAGQAIVDVVMPEVANAAAIYRGATRRRMVAGARRDKLTGLRAEGLSTEGALFEVTSLAAESEQQVLMAAATLRAAGVDPARAGELVERPTITLRSPIDGVVRELGGRLGEVVDGQSEPIAVIVGEGRPRIEARFLREPPAGAALRFEAVDGSSWPLRSTPVARVVEADDGAVVMWFDVEGDPIASSGLRGAVEVVGGDASTVQVPVHALAGRGDALTVYRRRGDAIAEVPVALLSASGAAALVRAREAGALVVGDRVAEDARAHERTSRSAAGGEG